MCQAALTSEHVCVFISVLDNFFFYTTSQVTHVYFHDTYITFIFLLRPGHCLVCIFNSSLPFGMCKT